MNSDISKEITVIASFKLKPGTRDSFIRISEKDSEQSLKNEAGCRVFDILIPEKDKNSIVLYEIYSDMAAFDNHKTMPHYLPFIEGTAPLLDGEPEVRLLKNFRKHHHN